jgi:hypothetical protein
MSLSRMRGMPAAVVVRSSAGLTQIATVADDMAVPA